MKRDWKKVVAIVGIAALVAGQSVMFPVKAEENTSVNEEQVSEDKAASSDEIGTGGGRRS